MNQNLIISKATFLLANLLQTNDLHSYGVAEEIQYKIQALRQNFLSKEIPAVESGERKTSLRSFCAFYIIFGAYILSWKATK